MCANVSNVYMLRPAFVWMCHVYVRVCDYVLCEYVFHQVSSIGVYVPVGVHPVKILCFTSVYVSAFPRCVDNLCSTSVCLLSRCVRMHWFLLVCLCLCSPSVWMCFLCYTRCVCLSVDISCVLRVFMCLCLTDVCVFPPCSCQVCRYAYCVVFYKSVCECVYMSSVLYRCVCVCVQQVCM